MNKFLKTSLALSLLVLPAAAWGAGFAIWEMGTQSSAMGGTMTAWPDDPTAIFYNPAGLASLGSDQLAINVSGIKVNTEFSGVAPNPGYGVQERLADAFHIVPQIYYSKALRKDLALGIGVCSPYGLAVEWDDPETYSGRAIATYTDLKTYFVMPTIAWKPSCKFMVGAGVNIVKGSVTLEQTIVQGLPNPVDAGTVSIEGSSDLTYSFNLGLLARLFVDMRTAQNGVPLDTGRQRNGACNAGARTACRFDDFRGRNVEDAMVERLQPDSDSLICH